MTYLIRLFLGGRRLFLVGALLSGFGGAAYGALAGYLKIPDIEGESMASAHEGEIEVHGLQWEIAVDTESGAIRSAPEFGAMTFRKQVDKSTPLLMLRCANGATLERVEFSLDAGVESKPFRKLNVVLEGVQVVRVAVDDSFAEDGLSEEVSFIFEEITFESFPRKDDGSPGQPGEFSWDLKANAPK